MSNTNPKLGRLAKLGLLAALSIVLVFFIHFPIFPTAKWEFDKAAAIAESWVPEQGYLLGEQVTIADLLLAHTLMWATRFEQTIPPKLAAYRDRLAKRPALQAVLAKTQAIADAAQAG